MCFQPSFSSDADFLKSFVLQEMSTNAWYEMFSSAEDQAECVHTIALSIKFRSKLR